MIDDEPFTRQGQGSCIQEHENTEDVYAMKQRNESHHQKKSSLLYYVQGDQNNQQQESNARNQLENSCVTFQFYNSYKFASNSTANDQFKQQNGIQNCFYYTRTTNQTISVEKERLLNGEKSETLKNIKVVDVAKVSSDYCYPCTAVMKQP